ncbi:MAG: RNA methyltransferase, partial [Planctomycetota bacterium]|nr:RNA methyltransferase [Planctomycetota bacterium]
GLHVLEEALAAGASIDWVLVSEDRLGDSTWGPILERARSAGAEVVSCEAKLLAEGSDLSTPPGLLAVCSQPELELRSVLGALTDQDFLLVCAGVQDPGNVGAIVRVAAGLGAAAVVCLKGGASAWSPRALRGASGTTFRLPTCDRVSWQDFLSAAQENGIRILAADAGGDSIEEGFGEKSNPCALVLGEEGKGIPDEVRASVERVLSIPLSRGVESLNVATAAAVLSWNLR